MQVQLTRFETHSYYNTLVAEQTGVQAEKSQERLLSEYNGYIFPGQAWQEPRGSAVADFVKPLIGDGKAASLEAVLRGLSDTKLGQPINWVDMGGGRALPMRQLASTLDIRSKLQMTNVDLFNFGLEGCESDEIEYLESLVPGMTKPEAEPTLITDSVETVNLPEPADIITSVEVMQYLDNPLAALANWYNQLADNGIMIVATGHDWAGWMRYKREPDSNQQDETPTKHVLKELSQNGIHFAVTSESDWESGYRPKLDPDWLRIMAIQKKPGTLLRVTKPVTKIWISQYNFKAVYYEVPADGFFPIVEVERGVNFSPLDSPEQLKI